MQIELPEGVTLKSCPCCGGKAVFGHTSRIPQNTGFIVYCENRYCLTLRAQESELAAIAAWNRRDEVPR
ncbi:hypothetical protein EVG80_15295 [Salmonella enterica subsp. enterica serovar Mississippi]|nr:hypothetical protein [Salmonella enterica subsp. enterica serovar Mississippi]